MNKINVFKPPLNNYRTVLGDRNDTGSDSQIILQTVASDAFQQIFNNQGEIKSGSILVGLATTQVYSKLIQVANGQYLRLVFIHMFLLSGITSIAACIMALSHARSEDVQLIV